MVLWNDHGLRLQQHDIYIYTYIYIYVYVIAHPQFIVLASGFIFGLAYGLFGFGLGLL